MIQFSKPTLGKEEEQAVIGVIRSGWLAAGQKTKRFEDLFGNYVGAKYAIFTNSCTSALKMAYKYYKEENPKGYRWSNLIYPKNTYNATYSAAYEMGYQVDENNFDDYAASLKVNVHYGGVKDTSPCEIEDSAHRIEPNDKLIGKIRCYSFYVTKNMTTGYGGMFVTNDERIYEKARLYWQDGVNKDTYSRQHGGWDYTVKEMAGGYDGNDLAAAIGIEQLKKLPEFNSKRNEIVSRYNQAFAQKWEGNHFYPYFVRTKKEVGDLIGYLKNHDIQASYHFPGNDWLGVSLPVYPLLTEEEQGKIINGVLTWLSERY